MYSSQKDGNVVHPMAADLADLHIGHIDTMPRTSYPVRIAVRPFLQDKELNLGKRHSADENDDKIDRKMRCVVSLLLVPSAAHSDMLPRAALMPCVSTKAPTLLKVG